MACIASKITYETCRHSEYHVITCRCGRGRRACDGRACRILLSTSYPGACHNDITAGHSQRERKFRKFFGPRLERLEEAAKSRKDDEERFEMQCSQSLRHHIGERLSADKKKTAARFAKLRRPADWTRFVGVDLYSSMFGEVHYREGAANDVQEWWIQKPKGLTVLELANIPKEALQHLQLSSEEGMDKTQQKALLRTLMDSHLPPVPRFPGRSGPTWVKLMMKDT